MLAKENRGCCYHENKENRNLMQIKEKMLGEKEIKQNAAAENVIFTIPVSFSSTLSLG